MQTVTLRNGSEELDSLVITTMTTLRRMMNDGFTGLMALYDLHQVCLETGYQPAAQQLEYLKILSMLQPNGRPHDSIRNIVLSAVQGEGLEMELVNPVVNPA